MEKRKNTFNNKMYLFAFLFFIALVSFSANSKQDNKILKGKVVDNDGNSLPGVSVIAKGSTIGTVTDVDGNFKLNVKPGDKIVISFIGMNAIDYTVSEFKNISINIETGLVTFCCTNHDPSHCAKSGKEMKKLVQQNNCEF